MFYFMSVVRIQKGYFMIWHIQLLEISCLIQNATMNVHTVIAISSSASKRRRRPHLNIYAHKGI